MTMTIHGKNAVHEAIKANRRVHEIITQANADVSFLRSLDKRVRLTTVDKAQMDARFGAAHQGVAAVVDDYRPIPLKKALEKPGSKLFVMLDSVEDPHNLGAVIRSVDAFGASGVIIPTRRSASITPTVVKVSTGAIEHVDIIAVTNLNRAIETLKKANVWVVGTDAATDKTLADIHVDTDLCIVFGSEGKGMHRLVKENCDYLVGIPMRGHVNSLNVSVACGVTLHDITRRRRGS